MKTALFSLFVVGLLAGMELNASQGKKPAPATPAAPAVVAPAAPAAPQPATAQPAPAKRSKYRGNKVQVR